MEVRRVDGRQSSTLLGAVRSFSWTARVAFGYNDGNIRATGMGVNGESTREPKRSRGNQDATIDDDWDHAEGVLWCKSAQHAVASGQDVRADGRSAERPARSLAAEDRVCWVDRRADRGADLPG